MDLDNAKPPALPVAQIKESGDYEEGVGVGEQIAIIMENRFLIFLITILFVIIGFCYSLLLKPVYKADGLVQVEEKGGGSGILKDLQPLLGDSTTAAAEQEILTSRLVLGRVIERLRLDIEVVPKVFPVVGGAIYRKYKNEGLNPAVFGLTSFAWGGEVAKIDDIKVPREKQDKPFTLTADGGGKYSLFDDDDELVLEGRVGERAVSKQYQIYVSRLDANAGCRFGVTKRSLEMAVKLLREDLSVKERGKKSGIIEVGLIGQDVEKIVLILDNILSAYIRQNVDQRSAEAEKTLKFLEAQLPTLKKEMDSAEAAYNSYRQARGSLDLSIETQSVLQSLVEVDNQIVALKQERDELRQNFTAEHPRIQAVDQRLERLKERRRQFDVEINKLPDTQQRVLQLARDVEVTTTLYTDLVNTAQQLKVSKAGTVGDVRVVDVAAAATEPIGLKRAAILLVSGFLGVIASLLVVWIRKSLRIVVEDPETIEIKLGLPVYATIPHSDDEVIISKRTKGRVVAGELLAVSRPEDDAIESLRGLRTTIHFALIDASHNSILITGSSPGLGKSFISKNLSAVLAQCGQKIVIVDADLRKGHINKEFGLKREVGVSEYVSGTVSLDDIIKPTRVPNLWVVTTGQIPPNPSELLMHLRFEALIEALGERFDTVIFDAPPILAVSDAAIIGRLVGATLLVARAGHHPVAELEQAIKRLNHSGVQVKGFVFNDLNVQRQRYRYGYKGYVYKYAYNK